MLAYDRRSLPGFLLAGNKGIMIIGISPSTLLRTGVKPPGARWIAASLRTFL
jgi:hypothetical protein